MIHVIIESDNGTDMAREVYALLSQTGRHVILDLPGDFRTSSPDRSLSSADVLVTARRDRQPTATT